MPDELIDIFDKDNNLINQEMKYKAEKIGLWHRAVHVWIYNSKGEVLLQKRAANKLICPNLWDTSAAGHIPASDTPESAAYREIQEELGVKASNLKFIGIWKLTTKGDNYTSNEHIYAYLWKSDKPITDFIIQTEELEEIKFISLDEFESDLKNKAEKYTPHTEFFFDIIKIIRSLIFIQ